MDDNSQFHKRVDLLAASVEYLTKQISRLEVESDETRSTLVQLQVSISSLNDYFDRQRRTEETVNALSKQLGVSDVRTQSIEAGMKRVEGILWGVVFALSPVVLAVMWELFKHFFGK